MPSVPEPAVDERFDELAALIRARKPRASEELRERVRTLAAVEPARGRQQRVVLRVPRLRLRGALVLVPALLLALVAGAALVDLASRREADRAAVDRSGRPAEPVVTGPVITSEHMPSSPKSGAEALRAQPGTTADATAALPPSRARAQRYGAELRVRVRDVGELSRATARAMRATRSLGGFVVRADYDVPSGRDGDSVLVVRVPVRRVQEAILRFSGLGTIVAQRISINDLQPTLDRQDEGVAALRRTIAILERELRRTDLAPEQRARLQARLVGARRDLGARTRAREATARSAATARIALTLTTRDDGPAQQPDEPGYFERTVGDAAAALGRALAWVVAALVIASPALALAAVALPLGRLRRRRAERRLLERS